MASSLLVTIVTPNGIAFEGEVASLLVPSSRGPLGLLPGYTPLIAELAPKGVLTLTLQEGQKRYFVLFHGALEVKPERTYLLSDKAIPAGNEEEANQLLSSLSQSFAANDHDLATAKAKLQGSLRKQ
ncbi:MAG: F0F1 ATP synthase subunit epsilon [Erysipelotrichaceae bacterium]|nr:F0F1 ATP synthase subunit epsilon [Erysipelotrichaceae bacterium]